MSEPTTLVQRIQAIPAAKLRTWLLKQLGDRIDDTQVHAMFLFATTEIATYDPELLDWIDAQVSELEQGNVVRMADRFPTDPAAPS